MATRFKWREAYFTLFLTLLVAILGALALNSCRTAKVTFQDVQVTPATPTGPWTPYLTNPVPVPPRPTGLKVVAMPEFAKQFASQPGTNGQICVTYTNRGVVKTVCVTPCTDCPVAVPTNAFFFIWHLPPTNCQVTVQSTTDWVTWKLEQSGWVTNGGTVCLVDIGTTARKHFKMELRGTN